MIAFELGAMGVEIRQMLRTDFWEAIFAKSEFEIFSREDIFANIGGAYCPRENIFPRKYLTAKISSCEFFSVSQICGLVGLGYAV